MLLVSRDWECNGYWKYTCGCIQYQDSFELCDKHKETGWIGLLKDFENTIALRKKVNGAPWPTI